MKVPMKVPPEWFTRKSGIYMILNTKNNKKYIGSSRNLYARLHKHRAQLSKNYHSNPHLQNAVNKYGLDSFKILLLEECCEKNLKIREQYYVNTLKPEYNIILDVVKNALPQEHLNRLHEIRRKSPTPEKIFKPVLVYDLEGNFVSRYNGVKIASKALNVAESLIIASAKLRVKQAKGYQFRYESDNLESPKRVRKHSPHKYHNITVIDTFTGSISFYEDLYWLWKDKGPISFRVTTMQKVIRMNTGKLYLNRYKVTADIKPREFRESPEVDNPEPSLKNEYNSIQEGATHSS